MSVPLQLPLTDRTALRRRVAALAGDRPGTYRMLDRTGRVIYVGKAKQLRARLLSYFRARGPAEKAARILDAAHDIQWDDAPSEFAAHLAELRQIRRWRPIFNIRMNRPRRWVFVKVSPGPAPRLAVGSAGGDDAVRHYGPLPSASRVRDAVRVLNDLLGLRDCALTMPIAFAEQGDLFAGTARAGCMRHAFGTCSGPCAGFVSEADYRARIETALAFLEGRAAAPLDRVVTEMVSASDRDAFEQATRWRDRFEALEWLFAAVNRARTAIETLSFVYEDPGPYGEDRVYVIKRATVRAAAPAPRTPIEREAFRALVAEHAAPEPVPGPLPVSAIDEMLLLLSWFRRHPAALKRTVALDAWLTGADAA